MFSRAVRAAGASAVAAFGIGINRLVTGSVLVLNRLAVANQHLSNWQREARHRAKWLGARSVWQLATDPHIQALIHELDPTGNLSADLCRVCAEAIADVVDRRMIHSCRPLTVRAAQ